MSLQVEIPEQLLFDGLSAFQKAQDDIKIKQLNVNKLTEDEASAWADGIIAQSDLSDIVDIELYKRCLIRCKQEEPLQWDNILEMTAMIDMETIKECERISEAEQKAKELDAEFENVVKEYKSTHP